MSENSIMFFKLFTHSDRVSLGANKGFIFL